MTEKDIAILQRENMALRGIVRAQALIIKGLWESMPDEIRALENSQRAIRQAETILLEIGEGNYH
jgi:hypothetical protein